MKNVSRPLPARYFGSHPFLTRNFSDYSQIRKCGGKGGFNGSFSGNGVGGGGDTMTQFAVKQGTSST